MPELAIIQNLAVSCNIQSTYSVLLPPARNVIFSATDFDLSHFELKWGGGGGRNSSLRFHFIFFASSFR